MFGFFKRKTTKHHAAHVGVPTKPNVDVSLLCQSKRVQCSSQRQREEKKRNEIQENFGDDVLNVYQAWAEVTGQHFLFVYQKGSKQIVEVVEFYEPEVNRRGEMLLAVNAPRAVKNDQGAEPPMILEWDSSYDIPLSNLVHHEWISEWHDQVEQYDEWYQRGKTWCQRGDEAVAVTTG